MVVVLVVAAVVGVCCSSSCCGGCRAVVVAAAAAATIVHRVSKKTSTHIIGYKLGNSFLILIIFDNKIPHII